MANNPGGSPIADEAGGGYVPPAVADETVRTLAGLMYEENLKAAKEDAAGTDWSQYRRGATGRQAQAPKASH